VGKDFKILGELYHGDPGMVLKGFEEGGFDALFDFPLYFAMVDVFCEGQEMGRLASILSLDRLYKDARSLVTFADNHDLPRVRTACKNDPGRVAALMTFMLSARGVPCVTYGTEAGLEGAGEPANRADMDFAAAESELAQTIRRLLEARAESPALARGKTLLLEREDRRLSYLRLTADDAAFVAINLGKEAWTPSIELDVSSASDVLRGRSVEPGQLEIPPGRTAVYRLEEARQGVFLELLGTLSSDQTRSLSLVVDAASTAGAGGLKMVGAGPELGSWDPARGVAGRQRADGSWLFEIELPVRTTAAFKLVKVQGEKTVWEEGKNRYLDIAESGNDSLELRFQGGAS
jgi:hypothetical protein